MTVIVMKIWLYLYVAYEEERNDSIRCGGEYKCL